MIVTAGGIDSHIHLIPSAINHEALMSGVTTMIGGAQDSATGIAQALVPRPGSEYASYVASGRCFPMNLAFFGVTRELAQTVRRATAPADRPLQEDWGTTPAAIDNCLMVADKMDACRWPFTPIR
jgi:urease subunit alpha